MICDQSERFVYPEEVMLQEIIRKRKEEHVQLAEQKRRQNLERIREMKSSIGIHPLEQFPKEVWKKILDELDPWDRDDAGKVHPLFHELLKETRVRDILLPMVLWVPAFRKEIKNRHGKSSYKQFRLLSKSSLKSFDGWMENNLSERIEEIELGNVSTYSEHEYCVNIRFGEEEELRTLKSLLASIKDAGNPPKRFPMRALSVSFSEHDVGFESDNVPALRRREIQELRDQLKSGITAFLELFGDQIWHFRFFMMEQETSRFSFSETYTLFQNWASLMPNLKWLEFCVGEPEKTRNIEKGDKMTLARLLFKEYPFPRLDSLERLSLHFHIESSVMEIYETVIAANSHVQILDLICADRSKLRLYPIPLIQSLNLTGISVNNEDWMTDQFDLQSVLSIANLNWPLTSVVLELEMEDAKLGDVFRFLEKFPTLETVKLNSLLSLKIGDSDTLGYLDLPNLKTLDLVLDQPVIVYEGIDAHFFFSFQFLLPCKSLKSLQWHLRGVDDAKLRNHLKKHEDPKKAIDFRAGLRFLYDSNIWSVFPSLDFLVVEICKKREGALKQSGSCEHTYRRRILRENGSVTRFLKSHSCCQQDALQNCVVLLE